VPKQGPSGPTGGRRVALKRMRFRVTLGGPAGAPPRCFSKRPPTESRTHAAEFVQRSVARLRRGRTARRSAAGPWGDRRPRLHREPRGPAKEEPRRPGKERGKAPKRNTGPRTKGARNADPESGGRGRKGGPEERDGKPPNTTNEQERAGLEFPCFSRKRATAATMRRRNGWTPDGHWATRRAPRRARGHTSGEFSLACFAGRDPGSPGVPKAAAAAPPNAARPESAAMDTMRREVSIGSVSPVRTPPVSKV